VVGRKALKTFDFFVDLPKFPQAKCAEVEDKDMFFPDNRKQEAERLHQLKAICNSCIHEQECLEYALEKQISHGIWGGTTPAERDAQAVNKNYAFKGMALSIIKLSQKGISVNEIAAQLGTSGGYIRRVLKKYAATEQGAIPLHQQIKDSSKGWHLS
jgi:WhiB family transcriptional regulator, redox-sensing transcriptional regulator